MMVVENGLSERELEILKLVATGASNKEIAARLVISPNTVKVHLRNIFAKIEVVSRTEATLYAMRIGLVNPGSENETTEYGESSSEGALSLKPLPRIRPLWRYLAIGAALSLIVLLFYLAVRPPINPSAAVTPPVPTPLSRWSFHQALPVSGFGMAVASYEGTVFLFGGQRDGQISGMVSAYRVEDDEWQEKSAKPTPVSDAGAALLGEKIYIPGGLGVGGKPTALLEVYDPRSDRWKQAEPMPIALSGYALASFEGQLYVFGGWDGADYSDRVFVYDLGENAWQERQPMATPRAYGSAAVLGAKIMLAGGINQLGRLTDLLAYYPQRESAGEAAWESRAGLLENREWINLVALAENLYLVGGSLDQDRARLPILRYDENTGQWERLDLPPVAIGAQSGVAAIGNHIHFFGGDIAGIAQSEHLAFQAIYTVLIPAISR
ncbi:MAG: Kelch repeat-containing protein [Bellilinea sp.]